LPWAATQDPGPSSLPLKRIGWHNRLQGRGKHRPRWRRRARGVRPGWPARRERRGRPGSIGEDEERHMGIRSYLWQVRLRERECRIPRATRRWSRNFIDVQIRPYVSNVTTQADGGNRRHSSPLPPLLSPMSWLTHRTLPATELKIKKSDIVRNAVA